MPRAVVWLLLVVALAGPMLTHAEAAGDLARALTGGANSSGIETPDGRVGDDPNVASVWRAGPAVDAPGGASPAWDSAVTVGPVNPMPGGEPGASRWDRRHASWPPATAPERAAWLQVFRN